MPLRHRPTGGSHERLWVALCDILRDTIPQHAMQYNTTTFQLQLQLQHYFPYDIIRANTTIFNAFNTHNTFNTFNDPSPSTTIHHTYLLATPHSPLPTLPLTTLPLTTDLPLATTALHNDRILYIIHATYFLAVVYWYVQSPSFTFLFRLDYLISVQDNFATNRWK